MEPCILKPLTCPDCECKAETQPGTTYKLCPTCNGRHYVKPSDPEYQQVRLRVDYVHWCDSERNMKPSVTVPL